ncbi:MAG: polyprenyl synthetase family protein [Actinomycetota bacterium]|nr:polyprenyl synthetase family protein [Actinomycetota bacterium]
MTSAPARPSVTVPAGLLTVADRVETRLAQLFDHEAERWAALSPDLAAPIESLRTFVLNGGKRLRPAFCYWGFIAAGGQSDDERVIDAGAAFELLQAFALVHDDVMDGSDTRRGNRTTHLAYADRHEEFQWRGEGRRFGEGVAILVGDLAFVYADQLLPRANEQVLAVWDELRIELNVGQFLDLLGTARGDHDRASARRIARYKSGKYTIERPLHLGAGLAGRLPELQPVLTGYGDPVGEAFQLRDDLLGAFGDEAVTGKPVGDDLREGKPTLLLAHATEHADAAQRELLAQVGRADLTDVEISDLQTLLVTTGAVEAVEATIHALVGSGMAALDDAKLPVPARRALEDLATFVAWRHA